jgi:CBS domain-containing protein
MSSQVSDVLRGKQSKAVFSISPDEDALKAVRMMAQLNIGALLVMERDSVRFVANEGNLDGALVGDLMSAPVRFVRPGSSVDTCMAMMTEGRIRHLPVLGESGQVLGVVSIGDLVKDTISEQAYVIERLEHYITGAPS